MKKHVSKIAIVGTGTLFPESLDSMALWRNIIEGKDLITDVPPSHWMISDYYDEDIKAGLKTYSKRGAFLPEVDFNPMEFGMPPKTMTATDTVQTLSLLVCKKLIEDTNSLRLEKVNKKDISVILGIAAGTELIEQMSSKIQKPVWVKALRENGLEESVVQAVCGDIEDSYPAWTEDTFPGLLANVVAGRITNRFDFGGVNCVVDAACASSVSAMMMAVQQLQLGNADLVITGGADALNNIFMYMCFSKTPALSHSGDIRPFSAEADGTMLGEGVTMMALRRLEDAERDGDKVYAVLNSVGASSDGRAKSVYAPAAKGQALAIEQAYAGLDYSLRDVELVEAHGTGTAAGDAAEFEGLKLAFEKAKAQSRQYCALGSIKSQFGHTKSSAGAAGVFKAAMALHHKVLPPTIKVDAPNPALEIEKSPFYLNTESRPWVHDTKTTRKASVSSFGFGGSNYHVALEEYRGPNRAGKFYHSATELVLLDARDADELEAKLKRLFESYEEGRFWVLAKESQEQFDSSASMRLALIAEDKETLKSLFVTALGKIRSEPHKSLSVPSKIYYESQAAKEKIAFLFSGQGSQYPNMGAGLAMSFSAARRPWDLAAEIKLDDECKLHEVVFPLPAFDKETEDKGRARLTETQWAQPAIGTVALSQLELLKQLGVSPDCTAGHSYGEIPALYAAGVIGSAEDLLRISRKRGELMANASSEKGAMTAVLCEAEAVKQQIDASKINVTIANINSPTQVVVTGRASDVKKFEEHLSSVSKKFRRLKVATAFHSELVSNCADEFFEFLKGIKFSTPNFDVYSNTTGKKYSRKKETIRKTLAWQLAKPVLFRDQVEAMYASGARVFLEVGPGNILSKLVGSCLGDRDHVAISLDGSQHQDGKAALVAGLGQLAVAGVDMDFRAIWEGFDLADRSLLNRGPNARTVKIKGSNYQKEYPPKNGAAGVPKPNTENQLTVIRPPIREETMSDSMNRNTSIEPRQIVAQQPALSPEWLTAFSELQRNALEAQKDFHNTISQSHAQFLRTSEVAFQQLGSMAGAPQQGQPMIATQSVMSPPAFAPEPCAPIVAPAPPTIMVAPESIPEPIAAAPTPAPVSEVDPKELLLEVVAEKTGYPKEMLDMQLDLETGLGIDSIKRVEILSALQQQMPELKALDASELAATKTLQEIMDVSSRVLGGEVVEIPSKKKRGISP